MNFADEKMKRHLLRIRSRSIDEIYLKGIKGAIYADKLYYLDTNIEAIMRDFSLKDSVNREYTRELKKIKRQLIKLAIKKQRQQE